MLAPRWRSDRELFRETGQEATYAPTSLDEVAPAEDSLLKQCEEVGIDRRPTSLHDIEGKRVPRLPVAMEHSKPRIKAYCLARERGLGLKKRVEVVEDRVCRVRREPWRTRERRVALAKGEPVRRCAGPVSSAEANVEISPRLPVRETSSTRSSVCRLSAVRGTTIRWSVGFR
ncbi:MAG: hypothetical protein WKF41_19215 [Gaiellaceae bacterium]